MWFLTGTVGLGLDPEGRAAKPAADQIVEDAGPRRRCMALTASSTL
jgi:hypothetical protein